jgi:chemotaxis protein MotA
MLLKLRLDLLSVVGLVVSFSAILFGQLLDGGHLASLINGPALVIVFGGTIGAVMLQTPLPVFVHALRRLAWVFSPPTPSFAATIEKIVKWSNTARRNNLLELERQSDMEPDELTRKGLRLLVDGANPNTIRNALEVEIISREHREVQSARVFEGMGGYAPTIGIIGAVMGLIHVMENLADPSRLGSGIAAAFVATVYGVGSANLIYLPFANKLKSVAATQARHGELVSDGLSAIAERQNPRNIRTRLEGYLDAP